MEQSLSDFEFEAKQLNALATQQTYKLDHQLHVQFYRHAELNAFKSKSEGRKIFEDYVYVRILAPANTRSVFEGRATDEHKERFAKQYRAFLANQEQLQSGTPLHELPSITTGQVAELKHLKVETVEQLSTITDQSAQLLGTGGIELKQRAIRWLDERKNNAALAADNRDLAERVKELEKLLQARLEAEGKAKESQVTVAGKAVA